MANLTIDNKTKLGWITITFNDASRDSITSHFPIDRIDGVDIEVINGETIVELYISHFKKPMYLSDASSTDSVITVDSVNGSAPSSVDDLKDKILALTP